MGLLFMRPEQLASSATFHGLPIERRRLTLEGQLYEVLTLKDAADLLDVPEFGRRFLDNNIAPYGLELWPGAVMLAEFIARSELGAGREAIEIGCGLGLLAIVATRHGWRVTATDNDENALHFAACNAGLNGVSIHKLDLLDWNEPPQALRYERVFGADVLYQLEDHPQIARCTQQLLAPDGVALFADPNRSVANGFPEVARDAGFAVEVILAEARMDSGRKIDGRIFRLTR
jgi:predicted nicotinamide N-methyase